MARTTDSTIASPPKPAIFSNEGIIHGCSAQGRILLSKKKVSIIICFLVVGKGLPIDDVGVSRTIAFQEIRPGAGFKTGDFVKGKLGGLP